MPKDQNFKNHRRYMPVHHFVVQPILIGNFFVQAWRFAENATFDTGLAMLVGLALMLMAFTSRVMALTVQNRTIRLEERMRLMQLMPAEQHARIGELATKHLVGLRFASDEEVVGLAERCLSGELKSAADVKRNVQRWRPDYLRA